MIEEYNIPLAKNIKELGLREVHLPKPADEILIDVYKRQLQVHRPHWEQR